MKKIFCALVAALVLAAFSCPAFCAAKKVSIGILPVLDTLPLQVAKEAKLFEKAGLNVELVPFQSALERDTAMKGGKIDGYFGDIVATMLLFKAQVPLKIATVSYRTTPGQPMFGIVTSPQKSEGDIESLREDTVGMSAYTIIEYVLDSILIENKLGLDYFNRMEIKRIPLRFQALMSNSIDLALLPEPLLDLAEVKGGKILLTDERLDMPLTVICLKDSLVADKDFFPAFMDAYARAVKLINKDPEQFRGLMVKTCRVPKPLAGKFPVYRFPVPALPTMDSLEKVQAWMLKHSMLDKKFDLKKLVP